MYNFYMCKRVRKKKGQGKRVPNILMNGALEENNRKNVEKATFKEIMTKYFPEFM